MQSQQYRTTGKVFASGLRRAQSSCPSRAEVWFLGWASFLFWNTLGCQRIVSREPTHSFQTHTHHKLGRWSFFFFLKESQQVETKCQGDLWDSEALSQLWMIWLYKLPWPVSQDSRSYLGGSPPKQTPSPTDTQWSQFNSSPAPQMPDWASTCHEPPQ